MEVGETLVNGVPLVSTSNGGLSNGVTLNDTFDNFLTLLTTQLRNQDPLSPVDSNDFTNQLVQFTAVEQSLLMNQKLDELISLQGGNQLTSAVAFVGKEISADSILMPLQNGQAKINYELEANAQTLNIAIIDDGGQLVANLDGPKGAGRHEVQWDGTADDGRQLEDGRYGMLVTAADADGNPIALVQGITGKVTGVHVENGETRLSVGEVDFGLDEILGIGLAEDPPEEGFL